MFMPKDYRGTFFSAQLLFETQRMFHRWFLLVSHACLLVISNEVVGFYLSYLLLIRLMHRYILGLDSKADTFCYCTCESLFNDSEAWINLIDSRLTCLFLDEIRWGLYKLILYVVDSLHSWD